MAPAQPQFALPQPNSGSGLSHSVLSSAPSDVSSLSYMGGEKVRLRVSHGGTFALHADSHWRYIGGESFLESVPVHFKYADLMFRLSEKVDDAVTLKYQLPGEELDPDLLITVTDNDDLQEMFDEYFRALKLPGTPVKTFRLRVILYPASEEPLTPDELAEGEKFLNEVSNSMEMQTRTSSRVISRTVTEGRSSFDSNASSGSDHSQVPAGGAVTGGAVGGTAEANWMAGFRAGQEAEAWAREVAYQEGLFDQFATTPQAGSDGKNQPLPLAFDPFAVTPPTKVDVMPYTLLPPNYPGSGPGSFFGTAASAAGGQSPKACPPPFQPTEAWLLPDGNQDLPTDMEQDVPIPGLNRMDTGGFGHKLTELPSRISVFGDGVNDGLNLPTHISAFGYEEASTGIGILPSGGTKGDGALRSFFAGASKGLLSLPEQLAAVPGLSALGQAPPTPLLNLHQVPQADIRSLQSLGEGAFGEVILATCPLFGHVAVKWIKSGKLERLNEFLQEARLMSVLNHPNVLRFYGVVVESHENPTVVGIVTEFARLGSLAHWLKNAIQDPTYRIPLRQRAELALHAVYGMAYLHEMNIVHFDLKPENILVEGDNSAWPTLKVADFGLSKHKYRGKDYVSGVTDMRGTLAYMAPELVVPPVRVTEKADVWSMGVVLWELFTHRPPYAEMASAHILSRLMSGNLHLEVPHDCEPEWRGLIESCMEPNPASRPSFKELARQLELIRDSAEA